MTNAAYPFFCRLLQNLVNLLGIPSSLNFAVMGGVILIGVIVDQRWSRYRERRQTRAAARDIPVAAALAEPKAE